MGNNDQLYKKGKEKREVSFNDPSPTILILCEGTKTEPNYFDALIKDLRLTSVKSQGCGITPKNILEKAKIATETNDEVWCVFDRDNFAKENFNAAFEIANANPKIKIAYTNEAFELWYLLHFHYYDTAMHRDEYEEKLSTKENLGFPYKKNLEDMYEILLDKQEKAIKHAETLYNSYQEHKPESDNPSTTVHLLIKRLHNLGLTQIHL